MMPPQHAPNNTSSDVFRMSIFHLSISIRETGNLCGLFDIRMKAILSDECFQEMLQIVQTHLHFIMTHSQQEGGVEEQAFCEMGFRDLLQCVEEVGEKFGEDANVILDRNMEFYRDSAMENLYGVGLQLMIAAPHLEDGVERHGGWNFIPLQEGTMEQVKDLLRGAHVMA